MESFQIVDQLTLRPYQDEMIERALTENIICALGTGTGKTYIAVSLIQRLKHEIVGDWENSEKHVKRTVFVVPSVALVEQQSDYLEKYTKLKIGKFSGADGVDEWTKDNWMSHIGQCNILVMVHDIFRNLLADAILEPDRINLIIFDECHHAAEDHSYRNIMRLLHNHPAKDKPRILGLTASVINIKLKEVAGRDRLEAQIIELEDCLGSTVWTSLDDSLNDHGARPHPVVVQFSAQQRSAELNELESVLSSMMDWLKAVMNEKTPMLFRNENQKSVEKHAEKPKKSLGEIKNELEKIIRTLTSLGPYSAYVTSLSLLKKIKDRRGSGKFYAELIDPVVATFSALETFSRMLEVDFKVTTVHLGEVSGLWQLITPKVKGLVALLEQGWNSAVISGENFCCIIFVKERLQTWALNRLLQLLSSSPDGLYSFIKSDFCVGQVTGSGGTDPTGSKMSNSSDQLKLTLDKFRKGEINILVATEVIEEGLDVPTCNLILRFDPPQTYRSYVQSKGRARARDSKFIMMIEDTQYNDFVSRDLAEFKDLDETMKQHCYERSSPTDAERMEHFADEAYPPFSPEGTNASITVDTALSTLQRYCDTLPNDNMTTCRVYMEKDELENGRFLCTAHLPLSAAIKKPVKSEEMSTFRLAKKVAALKCCKLLYEEGELDANMLPLSKDRWQEDLRDLTDGHEREQIPENSNDPKPGTRRRLQYYSKTVPECFQSRQITASENSSQYFLYAIRCTLKGHLKADRDDHFEYDQSATVGLLSRSSMPVLPEWLIYVRMREFSVNLDRITILSLTVDQIKMVERGHYTIFQDVIGFGKAGAGLLSLEGTINDTLFAVPMIMTDGNYNLDWAALTRLITPHGFDTGLLSEELRKQRGVEKKHFKNAVVVSDYRGFGEERFYVMKIHEDLNPHSLPEDNSETTAEYLLRNNKIKVQIANQPLMDVRYCSKGLNFLRPKPLETGGSGQSNPPRQKGKGVSKDGYLRIVPELCNILPLTSVLYFKCRLLPSILYRIQSFLNTFQLYNILRMRTQIGSTLPIIPQAGWRSLNNDHRFQGLYSSSPNGLISSAISSTKRDTTQETALEYIPPQGEEDIPTVIPIRLPTSEPFVSSPSLSSISSSFDPNDDLAPSYLFFSKNERGEFYKAQQQRIRQRIEEEELAMLTGHKLIEPRTAVPSPSRIAKWAAAPYGCQFHLPQPPFLLDASFRVDPKTTPFPEITSLLTALTTAKAGDNFDLERLETIGDSFLKMTTCLYLYRKYPVYHEGKLSFLKDKLISNYNLYRLGKELDLPAYVINQVLEPLVNITPPGYRPLGERAMMGLDDKSLADVMEALIGMMMVECGSASALSFMTSLGLKVDSSDGLLGSGRSQNVPTAVLANFPGLKNELEKLTAGFGAFEEHIGYKFHQPAYLLQAFTHSSFTGNRITDCYQRLEFIGDAILDFLVTRCLYDDEKCFGPGELTDLRQAIVNNKTFSLLAAQHNFHNNIKYCSPEIFALIRKYIEEAKNLTDPKITPLSDEMSFFGTFDDEEEEFYEGYKRAEDPKTLGDVFESVAGAIFIDSGFSFDAVWRVYHNLMKERIEYCVKHCPKNPIRVLLELYPRETINFKPEILPNKKVRVTVEITETGKYMGIGNNIVIAKYLAAKDALLKLGNTTVTS